MRPITDPEDNGTINTTVDEVIVSVTDAFIHRIGIVITRLYSMFINKYLIQVVVYTRISGTTPILITCR